MPKTGSNARPYNRSERSETKKRKQVGALAKSSGAGKVAYEMYMHSSPGVASQARRELASFLSKPTKAKKPKR